MIGYILRRIVFVSFIAMALLFTWSLLGPTEYHYTKYHDVHIISEKREMIRNTDCDNREHDHFMRPKITVEWRGINGKGETKHFTTKFHSKDDSNDGVAYNDLKNGFVRKHNCGKSLFTWFGFILLAFCFIAIYSSEDSDNRYSWLEIEKINKFKISLWCITSKFLGYNSDSIMNVVNSYKNQNLSYRILKYKELYSEYNEEYKKFSEIQVTTNKE